VESSTRCSSSIRKGLQMNSWMPASPPCSCMTCTHQQHDLCCQRLHYNVAKKIL
jgi:hypothetical protein